jgi:ribosomal protein S18 acetylase RimI-like enzyme
VNAGSPIRAGEWPDPPAGARLVDDRDELAEFFADRTAAHIYALADLDEPFWSGSRWYRRSDAVVGLIGLPSGDGLACYSVATREPGGTLELLADLAPHLPAGLLITGPTGLAAALEAVRPLTWHAPHVRYELTNPDALPPLDPRVDPLGRDDLPEIQALFDADPGAVFFLPHMLDDGAFVGVRDQRALVAAAGTHVLSSVHRVAAIGAVYTAPSARGRGLGRAVTVAVTRHLLERVDTIGLNVAAANAPARRIYESIGFTAILPYEEAELA